MCFSTKIFKNVIVNIVNMCMSNINNNNKTRHILYKKGKKEKNRLLIFNKNILER